MRGPGPTASREQPGDLARGSKPMTNFAVRHRGTGTPYRVRSWRGRPCAHGDTK